MNKEQKRKVFLAKLSGQSVQIWCRNGTMCGIPRSCEVLRQRHTCHEKEPCSSAQYTMEGDWPLAKHIAGIDYGKGMYGYGPYKCE